MTFFILQFFYLFTNMASMRMLKISVICGSIVFAIGESAFAACTPGGEQHECSSGNCAGKFYSGILTGWQKCGKGYYCPGTGIAKCCPDTHSNSEPGAEEAEDCYKEVSCIHWNRNSNKQCKSYYDSTIIDCGEEMTSASTVHFEGDTCYTGYLYCNQFENDCSGNVSGYTQWDKSKNQWHTVPSNEYRCRCESDYESATCIGKQTYLTHHTQIYIDITTTINFIPSSYLCTKCKLGYYVNATTDINTDDDCESDKVCKCTIVPQGYYINGQCSIPDSITNLSDDICPPSACPAGQTTNATASTSQTDCHFTVQTQFCDAGGCFTLGDIQTGYNISPTDWQTVGN